MITRAALCVALFACDREPATAVSAPPAPAPTAVASPPAQVARGSDIRLDGTTTSGGEVLAIGKPRLQVSPDAGVSIAASATHVFATDRDAVAAWSLADGTPYARYQFAPAPGLPLLTVSPRGDYVTARGDLLSVAPTLTLAKALGGVARQFSSDGARLAMEWETPVVIDVAKRLLVETAPALPTFSATLDLTPTHLVRADGAFAWDRARKTWTPIIAGAWKAGVLAANAPVAIVADANSISRIDLAVGTSTRISSEPTLLLAVSPNGERLAVPRSGELAVIDTRSGVQLASTPITPGELTPIAFADDNVVVVRDGRSIRVLDVRTGLRSFPSPSRFVGWLDGTSAAISRGTALDQLDVTTRATTTLTAGPVSPPMLGCSEIAEGAPCRVTVGSRRFSATRSSIEVHDGDARLRIEVGRAPRWWGEINQQFVAYAVSPSGSRLATVWRRPDVFGPNEGRRDSEPHCDEDRNSQCVQEYFVEMWSIGKTSKRLWRHRTSRESPTRTWPFSKQATGALAFTHDGSLLLAGFEDGDVMIHNVNDGTPRTESLTRAMVMRIEIAPGDAYVFTEDGSGEQRIWPIRR